MKSFRKSGKFLVTCVFLISICPLSSTSAAPIWDDIKFFFSGCFSLFLEELKICGSGSGSDSNDENKRNEQVQKGINSKNLKCKEKSSKETFMFSGEADKKSFRCKKIFKEDKEETGRNSKFLSKSVKKNVKNKVEFKEGEKKFYKGVTDKKKEIEDFLNKVRGKKKFFEDKDGLYKNFEESVYE